MDAAMACMKYILFTFNFIVWCMGTALMGLGIWIRSDSDLWEYIDKLPIKNYYSACYVVICVGGFIMIVGFLGCCGAATESPCMLLTYFIIMLLVVILEMVAAGLVWKIASGDQLEDFLRKYIMEHVLESKTDRQSERFLDLLQLNLECCGANDKDDYNNFNRRPDSCHSQRTNNLFYHGCAEKLRMELEQKGAMLGGIALGLILLQITSMVFTMCLYAALRQETKDYL